MFIKRLDDCEEIIANDGCRLKEVLHADRDALDLPYSLAFAWVDPGKATLPHKLASQDEVYTIFKGSGIMHIGAGGSRGQRRRYHSHPGGFQAVDREHRQRGALFLRPGEPPLEGGG